MTNLDLKQYKRFDRSIPLIGEDGQKKLFSSNVLIVGLGGVGGAAAECLIRSGIGHLTFCDGDDFELSNLNRQILATESSLGQNKAIVAVNRAKAIDAVIDANAITLFLNKENCSSIISHGFNFVVDAVDDIEAKVELVKACEKKRIRIISACGAGNRLDCDFEVKDLFDTSCDPIAKILRNKLRGEVEKLPVVCAKSKPLIKLGAPASIAFPPFVMGAVMASYVVSELIK